MLVDFMLSIQAMIEPWLPFGKVWLWRISVLFGIVVICCLLLIIQSIVDRIIDHFIN